MAGLTQNYDITRLYEFENATVPDLIDTWLKDGVEFHVSDEDIQGLDCKRIECSLKGGARIVMIVSPEQSYSLLKGQFFLTQNGKEKLMSQYQASYKISEEKGVWLIDKVAIHQEQGLMPQIVKVQVNQIDVDVEIDDGTFTFDGLGVPVGTRVYDKTVEGQPLQYFYKSDPMGELDDIAEEVVAEKVEENKQIKDENNNKENSDKRKHTSQEEVTAHNKNIYYLFAGTAVVLITIIFLVKKRRNR